MQQSPSPSHIDHETRNAFNELLVLDRLAALPRPSLLRVLKALPPPLLQAALEERPANV